MMLNRPVDPHILACYQAAIAMENLLALLTDGDIIEEMRYIVEMQEAILLDVMNQRHFGSTQLDNFMQYLDDSNSRGKKKKIEEIDAD